MSSTPAIGTTRGNRLAATVVAICWLVVLFDGVDLFIYGAVLPGMFDDKSLGLTPAMAGGLGSYATFGMLIGALASGPLTDRVGRKKVIIADTVIFSLASAACAVAPSIGAFGWARFVGGLGLGGLLPIALTLVAEYAPTSRRNLLIGSLMTAHQVGGIVAGSLGLYLLNNHGWRSAYWVGVVPLFIAVPLIAKFLPESLSFLVARGRTDEARALATRYDVHVPAAEPARSNKWDSIADLFREGRWKPTILFWITSFGGLLLVYGVNTWLPTMMRAQGYNLGSSLAFLIVINLGGVFGMLAAGKVADRFGAVPVAATWFSLTAVGVYLLGVRTPLALTFAVVFLAGFFLFSAQTMVYAAVTARYSTESRATAVGSAAGLGRFGAVFGPWLGGQLVAAGNQGWGFTAFALTAVLATVFVLLAGFFSTEQKNSATMPEPAAVH
ncbi:MFS transporter [Actinoplanes sp. NPDC020271]|uniref:MFS transporter n=1 Tax=Actinoplanes sp. NPDC020271 TaxID=3363896 RepID=UPI0037953A85